MKVYVTHDDDGNITSVNLPDPKAKIQIVAEDGNKVAEASIPGKASDFADVDKASAQLLDVMQKFKVEVPVGKAKLVNLSNVSKAKSRRPAKKAKKKRR